MCLLRICTYTRYRSEARLLSPCLFFFFVGVRALGCLAEQSASVSEKQQAPVCSSDQLDMLSCRDGAMQHCQQAPVSNEFSTAVLWCSEGGKVIYSVLQSPQESVMVTLCLSIIWSGRPFFPSLTLLDLFITSLESRMRVSLQLHPTFVSLLAACPGSLSLSFSLCQCDRVSI